MTLIRYWAIHIVLCLLVAVGTAPAALADFEMKKFNALISANETKSKDNSSWSLNWNMDSELVLSSKRTLLTITIDSDYSKSETTELDRLRTGFRVLSSQYGKAEGKWYPVLLIQTEGDHGGNSIHTLLSGGYRQKLKYGFIELTAGASKDVRTGDTWTGDVGVQFAYERKIGKKWKFKTGPTGEYGTLGQARLRGDRFRYSWDVGLDYQATNRIGIGYRLWYGNTVPNARRTQWFGITYKYK